jgi:hypothetical protein
MSNKNSDCVICHSVHLGMEGKCLDCHGKLYGYQGDDEHLWCKDCGTVYLIDTRGIVVRAGSTQSIPWTRVSPNYETVS